LTGGKSACKKVTGSKRKGKTVAKETTAFRIGKREGIAAGYNRPHDKRPPYAPEFPEYEQWRDGFKYGYELATPKTKLI
jgi:hypothetical protein